MVDTLLIVLCTVLPALLLLFALFVTWFVSPDWWKDIFDPSDRYRPHPAQWVDWGSAVPPGAVPIRGGMRGRGPRNPFGRGRGHTGMVSGRGRGGGGFTGGSLGQGIPAGDGPWEDAQGNPIPGPGMGGDIEMGNMGMGRGSARGRGRGSMRGRGGSVRGRRWN
jgi:hypothetical protein